MTRARFGQRVTRSPLGGGGESRRKVTCLGKPLRIICANEHMGLRLFC
jgi:hypothetical protein